MSRASRADIEKFFETNLYVPTRTLFVGSEHVNEDGEESGTDSRMAERVIKGLHILANLSEDPITLIMNNPGGDEYSGMAIYDAIKECPAYITVKVYGQAMSMGSIILQAADKRVLTPNAKFMIHYGSSIVASPELDSLSQENWTAESKRFNRLMEKIFLDKIRVKHPNFSLAALRKMLGHDTILTAEETIHLGLADEIG